MLKKYSDIEIDSNASKARYCHSCKGWVSNNNFNILLNVCNQCIKEERDNDNNNSHFKQKPQ